VTLKRDVWTNHSKPWPTFHDRNECHLHQFGGGGPCFMHGDDKESAIPWYIDYIMSFTVLLLVGFKR
jgi:hypothetical protein